MGTEHLLLGLIREEEGVARMKSLIPLADIMKISGEELELLTASWSRRSLSPRWCSC